MNNENGFTMGEMMTYEDLLRHLERDRQEAIDILIQTKVEVYIETDGLVESLQKIHKFNDIIKDSDYYLQDEDILYQDFFDLVSQAYNAMTNEEIIQYYKENAPLVFDPVNYLQQLFNK